MNYVIQFQLNIVALFIILILFVTIKLRSKIYSYSIRLLELTMLLTSLALIVDPLTWILGRKQFFGAFFLGYSTNFFLVLLAPLIGGMMLSYIDYYIFRDIKRTKKRFFYQHFTGFTLMMLLINIFYPIYFSIDPVSNSFHTESYDFIHSILIFTMYLYMLVFLYRNRKKTYWYAFYIFAFFLLLPIVGMLIQSMNIYLNFAWTSISLSILVTYIFLETNTEEKDYLTKLYNRQSYEKYISHLINTTNPFSIGLIDLDNFKNINDEFGHLHGDQVLVSFGRILKKSLSPNNLVCRLAGDEFIFIVEDGQNLEYVKKQVDEHLHKSEDEKLNQLSYSIGWVDYELNMTMDQLYVIVDKNMYRDKRKANMFVPTETKL